MIRLEPEFHEKVWGTTRLAPWFPNSANKIGEVVFPAADILVKFIFTTESLSVQVHPPGQNGKTEMWHILRAEPGAAIALGFREPVTHARLRAAAASGEIVDLLEWVPVRAGDTLFAPGGTVHAIGGGIVLCEIQQPCGVTYRLYDYGRPRELHLEQAAEVACLTPHDGHVALPVSCDYFVTDALTLTGPADWEPAADRDQLLVVLDGEGTLANEPLLPGQVWRVLSSDPPLPVVPAGELKLLRTRLP